MVSTLNQQFPTLIVIFSVSTSGDLISSLESDWHQMLLRNVQNRAWKFQFRGDLKWSISFRVSGASTGNWLLYFIFTNSSWFKVIQFGNTQTVSSQAYGFMLLMQTKWETTSYDFCGNKDGAHNYQDDQFFNVTLTHSLSE
jgi:hypothetical protein